MAGKIDARLAELGIELPEAPAPAANYVPWVKSGYLLFVAGQVSGNNQGMHKGRLGDDLSLEDGVAAARACALNLVAQAKAGCGGDLDRVAQVVKLGGFVACTPDFVQQPQVINGASDLIVDIFGAKGRHARFAVGAPALPMGFAVEIDAMFEIA